MMVLAHLQDQTFSPTEIVIICDGWEKQIIERTSTNKYINTLNIPHTIINISKHQPGKEQPRNIGVRYLRKSNYVWFLDSDCLPIENCLEEYALAFNEIPAYDRILIGPYEWMPEGTRHIDFSVKNDPRWDLFDKYDSKSVFFGKLNVALANFSGNLVWPIKEFKRVGGFWNKLHMGRCEDGELGLRASAMGVPMSVVREARAFHLGHPINLPLIHEKNKRDVPLIQERHPYVEEKGIIIVDYDGKRFDYICECGEQMNTNTIWSHECDYNT